MPLNGPNNVNQPIYCWTQSLTTIVCPLDVCAYGGHLKITSRSKGVTQSVTQCDKGRGGSTIALLHTRHLYNACYHSVLCCCACLLVYFVNVDVGYVNPCSSQFQSSAHLTISHHQLNVRQQCIQET